MARVFSTGVPAKFYGVLGRADWFPWSVPGLLISMDCASTGPIPAHSLAVVLAAFLLSTVATFVWWRAADQAN